MAMTTGASAGVQSDINVTPMIDVLLVLLIIFMITQPLSRMALDVQVPPQDTPTTNKTPPSQIVLELFPRISWIPRCTPSMTSARPSCSSSRPVATGSTRT
jgi:biopolymer transport protein ExbD